ncbi:MAG: tRNA (guanosine(37)-N1)-methyltransferase TrmD [Firmicutes bacterium]|nr:tRNA (guanosine(37)-N1)-methyltransferase TrmD [Bacillota bacterium]
MRIDILTLFPEMFAGPFAVSIVARAQKKGLVAIHLHDFRRFGLGRHRTVDDTPYGGGGGMILRPEPIVAALEEVERRTGSRGHRVLLSPQGETLGHRLVAELAAMPHLVLVCGHYEGFDERIRSFVDREVSIGDYVLSGGELPAMVVVEAVTRFLPGVLGDEEAPGRDSFAQGLLDYPQYTRPPEFRGQRVPEILLSGDHARIAAWRREQALVRTAMRRPDLMERLLAAGKVGGEEIAFLVARGLLPESSLSLAKGGLTTDESHRSRGKGKEDRSSEF